MELKDNIEQILNQKNMSPADLCKLVDIHRSTVYRYVSGACIPRADHLHKIASALNVSEGYLLGYEDNNSAMPCERYFIITLQFLQSIEIQSKVKALSEHEAIGKISTCAVGFLYMILYLFASAYAEVFFFFYSAEIVG